MALKKINYNGQSKIILRLCEMVNQLIDGGGGGGSTVAYTQTLSSGTKTGEISIDGVSTDMYAPTQPIKLSDLQNDTNFIDNTVNNLTNYYLKSETYTQAEVDALISAIVTLNILVVQTLPTQDISTTTIYLVPKQTAETQDIYDEYIYVNNAWELIGTTQIDLSNYYTKTEADALLADKVDKVTGKQLSTEDFTSTLKTKLDGIASGAEVNVQSDWNQSDSSADDYIKNKPTIPTVNNGTLTIKKGSTTLGTFTANQSGNSEVVIPESPIDINTETPTFTEAATRTNIASGETISTLFGKIKKFFTDIKDLAFIAKDGTSSTKYLRGDGTWQTFPTIPDISTKVSKSGDTMTGNLSPASNKGASLGASDKLWYYNYFYRIRGLASIDSSTDASKQIVVPSKSGTMALTSDIPTDFVSKASGGTFGGNVWIDKQNGTTSTVGESYVIIGNATSQGTAKNSRGIIRIYGNGSNFVELQGSNFTGNRAIELPNKAGTLALTRDIPTISFNGTLGFGQNVLTVAKNMPNNSIAYYKNSNKPTNRPTNGDYGAYEFIKSDNMTMIKYIAGNMTACAYGIESSTTSITWHIS